MFTTGHIQVALDAVNVNTSWTRLSTAKDVTSGSGESYFYGEGSFQFYAGRAFFQPHKSGIECRGIASEESARSLRFASTLVFTQSGTNVLVHEFKTNISVFVSEEWEIPRDVFKELVTPRYLITGPPDEDWTVCNWTLEAASTDAVIFDLELRKFRMDISELLDGLRTLQPLPRSTELTDLASRVASQFTQRQDEDIDEWARRLTESLSKADD